MARNSSRCKYEEEMELRRGPWTLEEDSLLIHYIARHGEGRWNLLARCSGLKRTGKSCRLRWLNYLKPDVKRGNLTPEEQIMILELHAKWGNRWSRIAQHLPGRTDNEIKNYWRTRVQKQARQLKIDANSAMFRDAVRCYWMPRLIEKMGSSAAANFQSLNQITTTDLPNQAPQANPPMLIPHPLSTQEQLESSSCYENCSPRITSSSESMAITQFLKISDFSSSSTPPDSLENTLYNPSSLNGHAYHITNAYDLDALDLAAAASSAPGLVSIPPSDCSMMENSCMDSMADSLWNMEELWQVRKLQEWGI